MAASRETLQDIAAERQLQPATLERVIRLIDILDAFGADKLIGPRVALKGGTVPARSGSPFVFPADWGDGHFIGVVRVLDRVSRRAQLMDVTPHVLRHTFASVAGDLGFSELTIAGLLGHSARGITQRYVHLDAALGVAADRVSAEIEKMLDGRGAAKNPKKMIERSAASSVAA